MYATICQIHGVTGVPLIFCYVSTICQKLDLCTMSSDVKKFLLKCLCQSQNKLYKIYPH